MTSMSEGRGFLPSKDPAIAFSDDSFEKLDVVGNDLPSLLHDSGFRKFAESLDIPEWPKDRTRQEDLSELHLYYLRLGFLVSSYVNQVGQPPATRLPANLAVPFCNACDLLGRPPILSYDGYALYNWKRFDPSKPIALGNIDTIQNFVHLYDEHWFILVHVEIEALASDLLPAYDDASRAHQARDDAALDAALERIASSVWRQVDVLRRIPEKMDPGLYYRTFRPYIRFFEHVVYEGVDEKPMNHRGETGAQSSIIPSLVSFMKIKHEPTQLTDHLRDMRRFMPTPHRELLERIEAMPSVRDKADKEAFNDVLEAMASFREVHFGWAQEYINKWVVDPRGTGGTPYMLWLRQLVDETRAHKIS